MRIHRSRKADAAYELNLAPFLDIVVSVIPMLLLSVAFIEIKMIETSIPQLVAQKIKEQRDGEALPVTISLEVSADNGFRWIVKDKGASSEEKISIKNGALDYEALTLAAVNIKKRYSDIFALDLLPEGNVAYNDLVQTMDAVRRMPASAGKIEVTDQKTGEKIQTDLMFVDVVFANVVE